MGRCFDGIVGAVVPAAISPTVVVAANTGIGDGVVDASAGTGSAPVECIDEFLRNGGLWVELGIAAPVRWQVLLFLSESEHLVVLFLVWL